MEVKSNNLEAQSRNQSVDNGSCHTSLPRGGLTDCLYLGLEGFSYRNYYSEDPSNLKAWLVANMTHPSYGVFVDMVSFTKFF